MRWDEGVTGWLLLGGVVVGGFGLCVLGGFLGGHLARVIDDNLTEF